MALNTCKMWFNGTKIAFFFQKVTKNRPTAGGFAPKPPKPPAAGGPAPRSPSAIPLSYTSFLNTFPKLDICAFQVLVWSFSLCKILITCRQAGNDFRSSTDQATISDLPPYDIFVPQNLPVWKIFDDVIACDLWFRPPPIKISGYAYELEIT